MKQPAPAEVLQYHRTIEDALDFTRAMAEAHPDQSPYFRMTDDEVASLLSAAAEELDQQVVLLLTASFEAVFQRDCKGCLERKINDERSRKFRKAFKSIKGKWRNDRIALERILDAWKKVSGKSKGIGNFAQLLQYRHWLAHGRHFVQKSGLRFPVTPNDAWRRGTDALRAAGIVIV